MNAKVITLAALALGLNIISLNAQESDAVNNAGERGFFAYGDFFQYKGAGAPGRLVAEESMLDYAYILNCANEDFNYYSNATAYRSTVAEVPSGNMFGGTVGYKWSGKTGNQHQIQGSYRSGNIDATISDALVSFSGAPDTLYAAKFKQETNEYRLIYSFSPNFLSKVNNYLTMSIEYVHSSFDGTFDVTIREYNTAENMWNYGYKSTANDLLVHATLRSPNIRLATGRAGGLWLLPRVDAGLGYSLRNGTVRGENSFSLANPKDILEKDAFVFETTLTIGLTYTIKGSRIYLDGGYRFRTDLSSVKNGVDQKGVYARVGYGFNW